MNALKNINKEKKGEINNIRTNETNSKMVECSRSFWTARYFCLIRFFRLFLSIRSFRLLFVCWPQSIPIHAVSFICSHSFSAAAVNIVTFFVVVCKLFDSAILPIDFYKININLLGLDLHTRKKKIHTEWENGEKKSWKNYYNWIFIDFLQ